MFACSTTFTKIDLNALFLFNKMNSMQISKTPTVINTMNSRWPKNKGFTWAFISKITEFHIQRRTFHIWAFAWYSWRFCQMEITMLLMLMNLIVKGTFKQLSKYKSSGHTRSYLWPVAVVSFHLLSCFTRKLMTPRFLTWTANWRIKQKPFWDKSLHSWILKQLMAVWANTKSFNSFQSSKETSRPASWKDWIRRSRPQKSTALINSSDLSKTIS